MSIELEDIIHIDKMLIEIKVGIYLDLDLDFVFHFLETQSKINACIDEQVKPFKREAYHITV